MRGIKELLGFNKEWTEAKFYNHLAEVAQRSTFATSFSQLPETMHLTEVSESMAELWDWTQNDPLKREYSLTGWSNSQGEHEFDPEPVKGEMGEIGVYVSRNQNLFTTLFLHSHGVADTLHSFQDITVHFGEISLAAVGVVTKEGRFLTVRASDTPDLSSDDLQKRASEYELSILQSHVDLLASQEIWLQVATPEQILEGLDWSHKIRKIHADVMIDLLRELRLGYFMSKPGESLFNRVDSVEQIESYLRAAEGVGSVHSVDIELVKRDARGVTVEDQIESLDPSALAETSADIEYAVNLLVEKDLDGILQRSGIGSYTDLLTKFAVYTQSEQIDSELMINMARQVLVMGKYDPLLHNYRRQRVVLGVIALVDKMTVESESF